MIETIADKRVFEDGVHQVELYRFASPHTGEMIVAYLPKEKILFEADMLDILKADASLLVMTRSIWRSRSRSLVYRSIRSFPSTEESARWLISVAR